MLFRISLGLIALVSAYLIYDIVRLQSAYFSPQDLKPGYFGASSQDADLIVVEYSNYTCDYCKEFHPILDEAMALDGGIIYVPRPILANGMDSLYSGSAAYAAGLQGQFMQMHHELLVSEDDVHDENVLFTLAIKLGLDGEKLLQDMESQEIFETLDKNSEDFKKFGTNTIPTLIIGGNMIYVPPKDYPTPEELAEIFQQARAQK